MDRQAGLALLQEAYTLKEKGDAQGAIEKFRAAKATKTDLGIDVEAEIEDVRRQVATRLVQEGEALAKGGDFPAAEAKFKAALALEPPPDTPVYVYVPAGPFFMGDDDAQEHSDFHTVTLPAYWIQRTEVTNAQYGRCVEAEGAMCKPPDDGNIRYRDPQFAKQPVTGVTWFQAQGLRRVGGGWPAAHGGGVGEGLPGRLEIRDPLAGWGQTKVTIRWIDLSLGQPDPTGDLLNFGETGLGTWSAVGSYPDGASPYGALDMAGNVWEWTSSAYDELSVQPKGWSGGSRDRRRARAAGRLVRRQMRTCVRCAVRDASRP